MKKILFLLVFIAALVFGTLTANAESFGVNLDFLKMFDEHGGVMLIIEPQTGSIVYANNAAVSYYGYTKEQLLTMKIEQINMLTPEEIDQEMEAATFENRNYFVFKHRLANGEIRNVEVFSYPVKYGEKDVLFSIVHDITVKTQLEEREKRTITVIIALGCVAIAVLLCLFTMLVLINKKLKVSKNEIDNLNALRKIFIDADDSIIYLKDDNLKYVFVNRAFETFYQKTSQDIIGFDDNKLTNDEFAKIRKQTDLAVLEKETLISDQVEWAGRVYKTIKFPVLMLNGRFGVGAYVIDITEEREYEKKRQKILYRHTILANVLIKNFQSTHEQLDYVLHQALELTESQYGYIYLYDEEKKELYLNSWTKGVMDACDVAEKMSVYQLEKTGIWGEVVRQRKPIVVNDFEQPNPLKKGYPTGHVALKKFMSVPVMVDDKIVAVVGLANKNCDYDDNDVYEMTVLMNGVWNAVERREAQEKLSFERNKYLQTLISIGDGVMVVDKKGHVEMLNHVAEKLTGWSIAEAFGKYYKEIFVLSNEKEGFTINDPIEGVLVTDSIHELENHAILTSADGTKYYIEDSAAPIKDDNNKTVGVVLVFRDVTDKKQQRKKIEYLSFHDSLTGLYNRRFFEQELIRLDTERNLPLSVVMGDVNGLKLTNDIFGHAFGDILLKNVADVLQRVCRADDIVSRWGGDEFALLLPKTNPEEAEQIIKRIKREFSKAQIKTINGSISMGAHTKQNIVDDIVYALDMAEEKMYSAKTLERNEFRSGVIDNIITTLHDNSVIEKYHSKNVSELCQELGRALKLSEGDIRKLKKAGYLHDIGKIVLNIKVLNKNAKLSGEELNDIKKHSILGYRILNSFDDTVDLAELVLAHHEKWDGSGYPNGLKGEEIPLLSRIISIAESYDWMIIDSSNTMAKSKDDAISEIIENAGTQFDPQLAELFVQIVKKHCE